MLSISFSLDLSKKYHTKKTVTVSKMKSSFINKHKESKNVYIYLNLKRN